MVMRRAVEKKSRLYDILLRGMTIVLTLRDLSINCRNIRRCLAPIGRKHDPDRRHCFQRPGLACICWNSHSSCQG